MVNFTNVLSWTVTSNTAIENTWWVISSGAPNRSCVSAVSLEEVLEVAAPHGPAELRSAPGVPCDFSQAGFVHVPGEALDHRLQLVDGLGLTPDHMCHDLRPDTEVQAREVWAVGRPVVLAVPRDDPIAELGAQELHDWCGYVRRRAVLQEPVLETRCLVSYSWPDDCLQHFQVGGTVYGSFKPMHFKALPIDDSHPGHDLLSMCPLAFHVLVGVLGSPYHRVFLVWCLLENKPFLVTPQNPLKPGLVMCEPELTGRQPGLLVGC